MNAFGLLLALLLDRKFRGRAAFLAAMKLPYCNHSCWRLSGGPQPVRRPDRIGRSLVSFMAELSRAVQATALNWLFRFLLQLCTRRQSIVVPGANAVFMTAMSGRRHYQTTAPRLGIALNVVIGTIIVAAFTLCALSVMSPHACSCIIAYASGATTGSGAGFFDGAGDRSRSTDMAPSCLLEAGSLAPNRS